MCLPPPYRWLLRRKWVGMSCAYTDGCPLYPTVSRVAELTHWLDGYCLSEPQRCERLQRFLAGETVPDELLPDGTTATGHRTGRT